MKRIHLAFLVVVTFALSCQKNERIIEETEVVAEETSRQCAAHEVLEQQLAADPMRAKRLEELENFTNDFKGRNFGRFRTAGRLFIPVVVNIVMPNASQVSDAQIQSQIDVLNRDFQKTNSELSNSNVYLAGYSFGSVANCDLEFYVSAIFRKNSSVATFSTNDAVKKTSQGGLDPTNASTMLNLWVCDLSSGLLGYAQFPGGNAATDGVVIDYQCFGTTASYPLYTSFNLGRTATHEVGHWLNLRHIWGDARCGNDQVTDTPQHDASNSGCPSSTHRSKCSGKPLEQWMNYMDYTNDACMYMFTSGQKTRMDAAIDGSRLNYVRTSKI